jgi:hypothetical protein
MALEVILPLYVSLDDDEVAVRTKTLTQKLDEVENVEYQRKEANARYRDDLKYLKASIHDLNDAVKHRRERRDVRCEWRRVTGNMMHLVRLDTEEVIETRAMTADERQEDLPLEPPRKAKKAAKAEAETN